MSGLQSFVLLLLFPWWGVISKAYFKIIQNHKLSERQEGREGERGVGSGRERVGATGESSIKAQRPAFSASLSAGGPKSH